MTGILEGYVDRDDLAKELSGKGRPLHRQTILRYEADGLPAVIVGGRKLYRLEAVREWLRAREKHAA